MPTSLRNSRNGAAAVVMTCPAISIRPELMLSSPLRQRSSVLLPDPLRPSSATTPPRSTSRETPFRTDSAPKLLWRFSTETIGMEPHFQFAARPGQRKADREIDRGDRQEDRKRLEGGVVRKL